MAAPMLSSSPVQTSIVAMDIVGSRRCHGASECAPGSGWHEFDDTRRFCHLCRLRQRSTIDAMSDSPAQVTGSDRAALETSSTLPIRGRHADLGTTKLRAAVVHRRYHATLRAYLGTTPYRWRVIRGQLPPGVRLSSSGVLSGRPRRAGAYRFGLQDHSRPPMRATAQLELVVGNRKR
jgi:hypothetical protein